jgi:hypothetical protein
MPPKRKRERRFTPQWVDSLIAFLEIVSLIGTVAAGIYALYTLFV